MKKHFSPAVPAFRFSFFPHIAPARSILRFGRAAVIFAMICWAAACGGGPPERFFGRTSVQTDGIFRYVSGAEPESLDPHRSAGQPEARLYMAMYEGLVEYHPKDLRPIPAIAERWETGPRQDEYIFYLRRTAKWSDGRPITARDFLYSFRRALDPKTASKTASLAYFIRYAEAFNAGKAFVRRNGEFLRAADFAAAPAESAQPSAAATPKKKDAPAATSIAPPAAAGPDTEFRWRIQEPARLTVEGSAKGRDKQAAKNPKLKALFDEAAAAPAGTIEFVPVSGEDIGVEAIDDYTFRITLHQPVPFFVGLLGHQIFRLVPEHRIRELGDRDWVRPENIVTCGPFKLKEAHPYDKYVLERDPNYWDAANVHLNGIEFYPIEELTTTMNLYKAGMVDAFLNHGVPKSWVSTVSQYRDEYLNFPENATSYYSINISKPPFTDPKVRQAFSLAIDRELLTSMRGTAVPLHFQTPTGIFPDYDRAMERVGEEIRQQRGLSAEEWQRRKRQFDPELARRLLTEAGYPVEAGRSGADGQVEYSTPVFPVDKVFITYNTNESNRQTAEFIQAQWRRHLGITVTLKNMEFKTFLSHRNSLEYEGFVQTLWGADYADPYTFLGLHYGRANDGGSGFADPEYDRLLDAANEDLNPEGRFEKMARAEYYLMDQTASIPLTVTSTNWMKKPYVKGMYPNSGSLFPWKFIRIAGDPADWDQQVERIMQQPDPVFDRQIEQLMRTMLSVPSQPQNAASTTAAVK